MGDAHSFEKTSRRRFAKTIASALVAVPVASSLSSCSPSPNPTSLALDASTPTPQPSPSPNEIIRAGNPPVIIDGGSLMVLSARRLRKHDDDESLELRPSANRKAARGLDDATSMPVMDPFRASAASASGGRAFHSFHLISNPGQAGMWGLAAPAKTWGITAAGDPDSHHISSEKNAEDRIRCLELIPPTGA